MTARVSWHDHKFVAIWYLEMELQENKFLLTLNYEWQNFCEIIPC